MSDSARERARAACGPAFSSWERQLGRDLLAALQRVDALEVILSRGINQLQGNVSREEVTVMLRGALLEKERRK